MNKRLNDEDVSHWSRVFIERKNHGELREREREGRNTQLTQTKTSCVYRGLVQWIDSKYDTKENK